MYKNIKPLVISILIPLGVGGLAGLISGGGMDNFSSLNKPLFSPPGWLFPIAWTILYLLMGLAAYLIWDSEAPEQKKRTALVLYGVQLVVNFLWPILFFSLSWYFADFLWILLLWVLILLTTVKFYRISPRAGDLMLPYLLWVTFAAYLNWGIYQLN